MDIHLVAAMKESMENGASGIYLFTPNRMTAKHWDVLQKVIYTDNIILKEF